MGQSTGNAEVNILNMEYSDEVCKVWAKMPQYRKKLEQTQYAIQDMLKIAKKTYIAFSCGKDSSVLAALVLSVDNTVPCRFVSSGETRILHNVDDVMDYFKAEYKANIEEISFDRVWSKEWQGVDFNTQRKAGRRDIQTLDNTQYDGVFMGLRKQESRGRCISLAQCRSKDLPRGMYKYKNRARDYYRMCPLADWKIEDIGAYIVSNKIPTLNWYKKFGYEGRTTARLTGDSIRQNSLFFIKANNPEGYYKLLKRFPELNIYS